MKLLLLALVGTLLVVAGVLFTLSFRRDRPMLGLAGLTAALGAAVAALPYSGLQDF